MRLSLSTFRNTANATISVAELQKYIRPAGTGNNNYLFNKLLCGVYRELQVCTEAVQRQWHLTVWRFILSSPFLKALMIQKPLPKQVTLLHTPERSPDEQSTQSVFVREWVSEKCTLTALGKKNLYSLLWDVASPVFLQETELGELLICLSQSTAEWR